MEPPGRCLLLTRRVRCVPARVRYRRQLASLACALMLVPLIAHGATAPEAGAGSPSMPNVSKSTGFSITRYVIAGGGGTASGGAFAISGTVAQADADPLHPATGGVFGISGGFWPGIAPAMLATDLIFANGFEPAPP